VVGGEAVTSMDDRGDRCRRAGGQKQKLAIGDLWTCGRMV